MAHNLDYIGFTYGGVHSSSLKILRVSQGSRHDRAFFPTLEDQVVNVPGGDGQYFFNTNYGSQTFNLALAYDNLLEEDMTNIRRTFTGKEVKDLIFDELPFKVYSAKATGNASFKFLPFGEGPTGRLYKGEATIAFTAFYPFARSRFKWLEDYTQANIPEWENETGNLSEWIVASGIVPKGYYDVFAASAFSVFNPGDAPTHFIIDIPFGGFPIGTVSGISFYIEGSSEMLNTSTITPRYSGLPSKMDSYLRLNTKMNVLEGLDSNKKQTGNLYNDCIVSGNFFRIPNGGESRIAIVGAEPTSIDYNFLYV